MKVKVIKKVEVEENVKYLQVIADVGFWEDGEAYMGAVMVPMPCRNNNDTWTPLIDLDTGQIVNWTQGVTANVHFKVVDRGVYILEDEDQEVIRTYENIYVPNFLSPNESGWGDYMIMKIDENGFIEGFKADLEEFNEYEDYEEYDDF